MSYATVEDCKSRMLRDLSSDEEAVCASLLEDAAIIIDSFRDSAKEEAKKLVSCRMVIRALGDGSESVVPVGATQGSMAALGYSQSWTLGSGAAGELYLSKTDKSILGAGNSIGAYNPLEVRND